MRGSPAGSVEGDGPGDDDSTVAGAGGSQLGLAVRRCGASALVTVGGELDLVTGPLLDAVLADVLRARRRPRLVRLVLHMSAVSFADAAGLSPVLHARAVLARRHGVLELRCPSPPVRRVLRLLALDELVTTPPPGPMPAAG